MVQLGWNLTPEANEAGAVFTPKINAFANELTQWELTVEDIQVNKISSKYNHDFLHPILI